MLLDIIQQQWLSKSEARTYLAVLELGTSPVSRIARKIEERRENTYHILENLENKWWVFSVTKNKVKSYYALEPKRLQEKIQKRADDLLASMPELLALANWEQTSVQLYEWLEWFKTAYEQVILSSSEMEDWEPFLTFIWVQDMNPALEKYLVKDFAPWRLKFKTKTLAIVDKKSLNQNDEWYIDYNISKHDSIIVDDPIFNLSNEIIVHWKDKVSVMMYGEEELSVLVVKSQTLHNALKSIFMLIWNSYKKPTYQ